MNLRSSACLICLIALDGCAVGPMHMGASAAPDGIASVSTGTSAATAEDVSSRAMDVRFTRATVTKIVHDPIEGSPYPDLVTLEGRELPERCLVLEVTPESVLARLPRQPEPAEPAVARGTWQHGTGKLVGKVVRRRRARRGCEVRLTFLRRETFLGVFSQDAPTERVVYDVTGKDGRFLFEDLPPGPYRLAFRPRGERSWLIRLREVPVDAVLTAGESFDAGRIDLAKRRLD